MDTFYANDNVLITWCVLEFKENVTPKEAKKAFNAWKRKVKITHKDFQYMWVLEPGTEDVENIHFNVFCSLDIGGADKEMFVKSARKGKKYAHEHNLTNWEYGFTTAYPIRSYYDLKHTGLYSTKFIQKKNFKDRERNSSESEGLIKPKVFYFDSYSPTDQEKIEVLLKDTVEIDGWPKKGFYYTTIDVRVYKRDRDGTLRAEIEEYKQEEQALAELMFSEEDIEQNIARQEAEDEDLLQQQEAFENDMGFEDPFDYEQAEAWYYKFAEEDEIIQLQAEVYATLADGEVVEDESAIVGDAVAVYISTPNTTKKYVDQLEKDKVKLTNISKSKGYPEPVMYIDFGYGGRSADRPAYQQMMVDLKSGKFNRIVTISINMVVNHPIDFYQFLLDVDKYNCKLIIKCEDEAVSKLFNDGLPNIMREQILKDIDRMKLYIQEAPNG